MISNWPDPANDKTSVQAIVLGLGSIFNHSAIHQNVGWFRNIGAQVITYVALRDIQPGEELTINYGKIWFVDSDAPAGDEEEDPVQVLSRIESS